MAEILWSMDGIHGESPPSFDGSRIHRTRLHGPRALKYPWGGHPK